MTFNKFIIPSVIGVVAVLVLVLSICCNTVSAANVETTMSETVRLKVENMSCNMCPITVRKSLEKIDGVIKATSDYDTKTATVTFDPNKTTVEVLINATTNAGYPSTVMQ